MVAQFRFNFRISAKMDKTATLLIENWDVPNVYK